jgi:rhodanese-related sulfurtransferase
MNIYLAIGFATVTLFFNSCSNSQSQTTKTNLSANDFAVKIKEFPTSPIIDVRTPREFEKGHLVNALNYNWNGSDFEKEISTLDKTNLIFIYCLSGSRSSSAANKMRGDGFKQVYEMQGGIIKWRAANFPETTAKTTVLKGLTK